jgi:hypothetical protein
MIAATRSKRNKETEKPLENKSVSKERKIIENSPNSEQRGVDSISWRKNADSKTAQTTSPQGDSTELPYADIQPLPIISRSQKNPDVIDQKEAPESGYENRAPLQSDEKAETLIREVLRTPIGITAEDLLNISEPARQELRKLLTKRRTEKKSVTFVSDKREEDEEDGVIYVEKLPEASYEVVEQETSGLPIGALIIGDPVMQYLSTLQPGEKPKKVVVAKESQGLRAVYPLINGIGEVESLLDSGSQIISMAKEYALDLEISWDPDIVVHMESANRSLEKTLGLAKNIPFLFGHITIYLQVHIMENPAYKVLLGRPFDTVTESLVKNERDGNQSLTLTDPNTGERCVMRTHERGKVPNILKKPVRQGFRPSMN